MALAEAQAREALDAIFTRLGLRSGDRVMLGIDMGRIPLPAFSAALNRAAFREREQRWCAFVLDALRERLGPDGTLLAPAFSYSCTKPGATFIRESTASETGPFTEYLRAHPDAVRSIHPVFSVAGIGPDAAGILENCGRSAFGARSPFARFAAFGVRLLCLGVGIRGPVTYVHHLEQTYGCPHRFNKSFDTRVIAAGVEIRGPWYAYLNYRGIAYKSDLQNLEDGLRRVGCLADTEWNGHPMQLADIADVDRVGYDLLTEDPSAFVSRPLDFHFDDSEAAMGPAEDRAMLRIIATERSPR